MSGDLDRRRSRPLLWSHIGVLAGLLPTVVAWWWTSVLVDRVAEDELTDFDPEAAALLLIGVVVAGSMAVFLGIFRVFRGRSLVVYWVATAIVWSAALGLGVVTHTTVL